MEVAASWVAPIASTEMGGEVIAGLRLGRLLGVPTANITLLRCDPGLFGSWAAFALAGDRLHEAIAHVGVRPSVGAAEPLLEVHLFDFDGDLYGEHLQVSLLRKVSEEVRLESLELLRGKIEEDVRRVRRYFDALRKHVLPSMTVE